MLVLGDEFSQVISIIGKGMSGIFVVIGCLMISVMLLNRFTSVEE